MNNSKKVKPNCSRNIFVLVCIGRNEKSSFDPSNGGIGIRLKKAKKMLIIAIIHNKRKKMEEKDPETLNASFSKSILNRFPTISNLAI